MALQDSGLILDIDDIDTAPSETKTYAIDFENGRITGKTDGLDAVKQAITKILITERFKNLIYSDNYGCEIKQTLMSDGNTDEFLEAEIPSLLQEALVIDERILGVSNVTMTYDGTERDSVNIGFDVETIYGKMTVEEVI
jgi:phage baseplate assembly protein W